MSAAVSPEGAPPSATDQTFSTTQSEPFRPTPVPDSTSARLDTAPDMLAATVVKPGGSSKILLRHRAQCVFCRFNGGRQCNRCAIPPGEGVAKLQIDDGIKPLLRGLATATWITDDILAISRPSSRSIAEYGLVDQFIEAGITTLFNLEEPGEHPYCGGEPLTVEGSYTYLPSTFEIAGITVHEGGWIDLGTPKLDVQAKLVRKACDALERGEKIAVHCHAGFGRTGVLIACILIHRENRQAAEVIAAIRARRRKCIQNPKQASFVRKFASEHARLMAVLGDDTGATAATMVAGPKYSTAVHPVVDGAPPPPHQKEAAK
jgi:hypothetical protein